MGYKENIFWNEENVRIDFAAKYFTLVGDLSMNNDKKYAPLAAQLPGDDFLGYYFFMNEGGAKVNLGRFSFDAGRFKNYDIIDSPYSLFINSNGISANTLTLKYDGAYVQYQSQWIEFNSRSGVSTPAWDEYHKRLEQGGQYLPVENNESDYDSNYSPYTLGFPDRGANYKTYALKIKDWRIGFLDAAVYTGRSFDYEYFLNPLPQYFIQYVKVAEGRPWSTGSNENDMIGFFWDIKKEQKWDAYAQVLSEDLNLGFLNPLFGEGTFSTIPWKGAWALGGRIYTPYGRFGFHHAGALKYTFEPIGSPEGTRSGDDAITAYGYSYYPETRYYSDGSLVNILIEDTMAGYKYGENNIAFQFDYQHTIKKFLVNAALELVLAGSNSPANPWQENARQRDSRTGLLDDGFETRLELRGNVSRAFGRWTFWAAAAVGGRFNKLELVNPADLNSDGYTDQYSGVADTIWIWKASNKHEAILRFSLGARCWLGVL
ncbi:MAG: hypothetical protein LBR16_04675 [Treponema sp.]|nr:hypothetical protein [Treponema sp.]